jgi:hypothetical protein
MTLHTLGEDMDAVKRGMEMLYTPQNQLPPLAYEYARSLCQKIGMCGEVFLTAFAAYAQCVEGLECEDKGYEASDDAREWFAQRTVRDSRIANDATAVRKRRNCQ